MKLLNTQIRGLASQLRHRKNPRIYPVAKTKFFRVREPKKINLAEFNLLQEHGPEYKRHYNSLIEMFRHENEAMSAADKATGAAQFFNIDEAKRINQEWNKETYEKSKHYFEKILQDRKEQQAELIEKNSLFDKKYKEKLNEKIKFILAHKDSIITKENLDQKVDEIIDGPITDYNFYVNKKGEKVTP